MTLIDKLKQARIQAMKNKQTPVKDVLGLVLAAIQQRQIDESDLGEDAMLQMIKKEIKSVRETQQLYIDSGREEAATDEQAKIDALQEFLPDMLSDDRLRELIQLSGLDLVMSNKGRIIGSLMKEHRTVIDPARLQIVLDEVLS